MRYHIIAFLAGFLLDLAFGDPHFLPHPIRLIGKLITETERMLRGTDVQTDEGESNRYKADKNKIDKSKIDKNKVDNDTKEFRQGIVLTLIVIICVVTVVSFILLMAYRIHPYLGVAAECIMTYQILAVKCLKVESMKVYKCLKDNDVEQARKAVSMIVGRDTECLDDEGITKAAVETVAENTSDGVIAPMLYLAVGGPILGFLYKAINTMDSMVGYKNDKYLYFGRAAAKLDDLVNFIPSRISAYLMIAATFFAGSDFSTKGAYGIYKRDRRKHASPNSGQTEAVCAGALSIRLAGDTSYFGKIVKKPYIGDMIRKAEYEDIRRVNHLMYIAAWLCEGICVLVMLIL